MRDSDNPRPNEASEDRARDAGEPPLQPDATHRLTPAPPEAPIGHADRYVLLEQLGAGGFGAVYRARDEVTDVFVALKVLPRLVAHSPDELEKVRQNFKLVARLRHPHIANVLHLHTVENVDSVAAEVLGIQAGDHLVVMDYVKGQTLSALRRRYSDGKVPVAKALRIAAQIAEALDYAHSRRIIHRDIKPANVVVTDEDNVSVLDFGLAAHIRSSMSRLSHETGDTSGTPAYMAPEQWAGRIQGPAADQYSLAVLIYEMLSGSVPFASAFESNSRLVMFHAVKTETPEAVRRLSRKQNRMLRRALGKTARDRFESCSAFVAALRGHVSPRKARLTERERTGDYAEARPVWGRLVATFLFVVMTVAAGHFAFKYYQFVKGQKEAEERVEQRAVDRLRRIAQLLVDARAALAAEEHTAAVAAVNEVLKLAPEHAEAQALHAEITLAVGLAQVVPVSSEAEVRWKQTEGVDRGQGFEEALVRAEALLGAAKMLFEAREYSQSLEKYKQLLSECERLQQLDAERDTARRESEAAKTACERALAANAGKDAKEIIAGAQRLSESAATEFENGQFTEAAKLWITACAEFAKAEASARGTLAVRTAQAAYETRLDKMDAALLEEFGGAEWEQLKGLTAEAERMAREGNWQDAANTWEEAQGMLEAAVAAARKAKLKAQDTRVEDDQDVLRNARLAQAVAEAEEAKAAGEWEAVLQFAEEALTHDPDSDRAKALLNEAQDILMPRLTIMSQINGREVPGATVIIDGEELEVTTPVRVRLERGGTYRVRIELTPTTGTRRYLPFEALYTADADSPKSLEAALVETALPYDLNPVSDADYAPLDGLAIGSRDAQERQRAAARELGLPLEAGSVTHGIRFRLVPAGMFLTVSTASSETAGSDDDPGMLTVSIGSPLYVGLHEITQGQWDAVMEPEEPVAQDNQSLPKTGVTWIECQEFCRRLALAEGVSEGSYRLLAEAEWEYACRAGTTAAYYTGDSSDDAARAGWIEGETELPPPPAQKAPNAWGLHDMHGSVWEWCRDWFGDYPSPDLTDPTGPTVGTYRLLRGGSWLDGPESAASSFRHHNVPSARLPNAGLRIARQIRLQGRPVVPPEPAP